MVAEMVRLRKSRAGAASDVVPALLMEVYCISKNLADRRTYSRR